jgi:hypothetical protein
MDLNWVPYESSENVIPMNAEINFAWAYFHRFSRFVQAIFKEGRGSKLEL